MLTIAFYDRRSESINWLTEKLLLAKISVLDLTWFTSEEFWTAF